MTHHTEDCGDLSLGPEQPDVPQGALTMPETNNTMPEFLIQGGGVYIANPNGETIAWGDNEQITTALVHRYNVHDKLVEALRVIGSQSLDDTWTVNHAYNFMREHARAALSIAKEGGE